MATKSSNITEALDKIYQAVRDVNISGCPGVIEYPKIANGPVELVLAFNNHEHIVLMGPNNAPYFSSHGPLTDLQFNELPGTRVATSFPVDPSRLPDTVIWPPEQQKPFDAPPFPDPGEHLYQGYSKQAYYFNNDKDWFVTVGPSIPKIVRTKEGGAQFWVGSIGAITQGGGRYAGARGVTTYVGSGYFDYWPISPVEQIQKLRAGFTALIGTYAKIVLKENVAEQSSDGDSSPVYEESQGNGGQWQAEQQGSESSTEIGGEEQDYSGRGSKRRRG